MVEVVFLGSGGAFSAGRRSNTALLIEAPGLRMLVEAGPPILQQLARVGHAAMDIDWLFVTHAHGDHMLGFPMLVLCHLDARRPLRVYAGTTTMARLKALWELAYPGFADERLNIAWHPCPEEATEEQPFAPGVTLRTAPVPAPPDLPTLAARWDFAVGGSLAFVTDTVPNDAAVALAHGCDLLIHEASFSAVLQPDLDPSPYFHSTARQAGEVARAAGCPRLALIHLGPRIGEQPDMLAAEARGESDLEVIVPEDGQRYILR